ncbi:MAG: cupin domain-containing protein [Acidimicrobiia bacterium]|nr:cupin domain-containing protein [Acidimicrobiia bacterium]
MANPLDADWDTAVTSYLHLYNDRDGESHFEDVEFPLREVEGQGTSAVWATPFEEATNYGLRVVPPGWERDWGPAARRMIAVYLSGEGEIEASDGEVRRLLPGMVLFAEDTAGRGHRVRHIGEEPVTVVHVVLPD